MRLPHEQRSSSEVVGPADGKAGFLGSIGVRFMIDGDETGQRFSLVEHPMGPRALAAPLHRHNNEDEYSYVLRGAWARCWATTSSRQGQATSSTSRAASGTRSGTPAMSHAASSRSSPRPGSSASSPSSSTWAASRPRPRGRWARCAPLRAGDGPRQHPGARRALRRRLPGRADLVTRRPDSEQVLESIVTVNSGDLASLMPPTRRVPRLCPSRATSLTARRASASP